MMKRVPFLVLAIVVPVCIMLCSPELTAQNPLALYGRVLLQQPSGPPVPFSGVQVFLIHPEDGKSSPRYTDFQGYYTFQSLPRFGITYLMEMCYQGKLVDQREIRVPSSGTSVPPVVIPSVPNNLSPNCR